MKYSVQNTFITDNFTQDAAVEIKDSFHTPYPYHRHNAYELYLYLEGDVHFYVGKECYSPKPGALFLLRPTEYHRVHCLSNATYRRVCVYFLPQYLNSLSSDVTDLTLCFNRIPSPQVCMIQLRSSETQYFISLATQLSQSLEQRNFGDDLRSRIATIELMLFINHLCQSDLLDHKDAMPRIVVDTMSYVEQHLTEEFSIEQLARDLYHNRSYVSRIFRETTGVTLQQYIINARLRLAKHILESGESISDACYKSGFRNYSNFIRTFTKNVGMAPLQYQRETMKLLH